MAAAEKKEKKPIEIGSSIGHITNLKQSILETFDTYGSDSRMSLMLALMR